MSKQSTQSAVWNARFQGLCDYISKWSEDRDFHVGAVIVGPAMEVRSTGYNGLPRGVKAGDDERFDRASGEKFFWFEHAERNALYNAARLGVSVDGCIIYINRFPCADCARAIIQSGISTIHCPNIPAFDGALDHSFTVSRTMLDEAGIELVLGADSVIDSTDDAVRNS